MQYCGTTDIEAYYLNKKFKCDDDNWLTSEEVIAFIIQEAAYIDSIVTQKYSLPITNQSDLMILKMINEKLVVGTIDDIFRERTDDNKLDRFRNLRKEALGWLEKIQKGEMSLQSTGSTATMKFNATDSEGNTVAKRFKDAYIPAVSLVLDRERRNVTIVS